MYPIVVAASKVTVDLGVILTGLAVTSALLYFVGSELFGSDSTTAIFSDSVDRIREHPEVRKKAFFRLNSFPSFILTIFIAQNLRLFYSYPSY